MLNDIWAFDLQYGLESTVSDIISSDSTQYSSIAGFSTIELSISEATVVVIQQLEITEPTVIDGII